MKQKAYPLITLLTVLFSGTAFSADALVSNQPTTILAQNIYSWNGGYLGLNSGYAWAKDKRTLQWNIEGYDFSPETRSLSMQGFIGGIQAGYNWQLNTLVLGVETDIQYTDLKKSSTDLFYEETIESKINWLGTTRARIGFTPIDTILLYATAGLAYGGVKASVTDYFSEDYTSSKKTKLGYTIGLGAEYALNTDWPLKTEYLYANLGKLKTTINYIDAKNFDTLGHKFKVHTVRLGLNYKF